MSGFNFDIARSIQVQPEVQTQRPLSSPLASLNTARPTNARFSGQLAHLRQTPANRSFLTKNNPALLEFSERLVALKPKIKQWTKGKLGWEQGRYTLSRERATRVEFAAKLNQLHRTPVLGRVNVVNPTALEDVRQIMQTSSPLGVLHDVSVQLREPKAQERSSPFEPASVASAVYRALNTGSRSITSSEAELVRAMVWVEAKGNTQKAVSFGAKAAMAAIKRDDLTVLKSLKAVGFDLNDMGEPLLHAALQEGRLNLVPELKRLGCDINAMNQKGQTPLHLAVWQSPPEAVKMLLELGANASLRVDGQNAVDLARTRDRVPAVLQALAQAQWSSFAGVIEAV